MSVEITHNVREIISRVESSPERKDHLLKELFMLLSGGDPDRTDPDYTPLTWIWREDILQRCIDLLRPQIEKWENRSMPSKWSKLYDELTEHKLRVDTLKDRGITERIERLVDSLIEKELDQAEEIFKVVDGIYPLTGISLEEGRGDWSATSLEAVRGKLKEWGKVFRDNSLSYASRLKGFFRAYFSFLEENGYETYKIDRFIENIIYKRGREYRIKGLFVNGEKRGQVSDVIVEVRGDGSGDIEVINDTADTSILKSAKAAREGALNYLNRRGVERIREEDNRVIIEIANWEPRYRGESLGLAIALAIVSRFIGVPIRRDVAVTGVLHIDGQVREVQSIELKAQAAVDDEAKVLIIPRSNKRSIEEGLGVEVRAVDNLEEAVEYVFGSEVSKERRKSVLEGVKARKPIIPRIRKGKLALISSVLIIAIALIGILARGFYFKPTADLVIAPFYDFTGGDPLDIPTYIQFEIEKEGLKELGSVKVLKKPANREECTQIAKRMGAKVLLTGQVYYKEKGNRGSPQMVRAWIVDLEGAEITPIEVEGEDVRGQVSDLLYANALLPIAGSVEPHGERRVLDPKSAKLIICLAKGRIYLSQGQFTPAIGMFKEAGRVNPSTGVPHFYMGLAYHKKGMYPEAAFQYRAAIGKDPTIWAAHNNLGKIYEKAGDYDRALSEYKLALNASIRAEDVFFKEGHSYLEQDMVKEAIDSYQNALNANPLVRYNLGTVYLRMGQYDMAIREFEQVISRHPSFYQAYGNLGWAYYLKGEYHMAKEMTGKALSLNSNNPMLRYNMGIIYLRGGEYKRAISEYKKALKIDKGHKSLDVAIKDLNDALEDDPNLREAYYILSLLYKAKGDVGKAEEALKRYQDM